MENGLIKWEKLSYEIEQAKDFDTIQSLLDRIKVYQTAARQSKQSLETQNKIAIYRLKLERKKGDWLNENLTPGNPTGSNQYEHKSGNLDNIKLSTLGISFNESANSRRIAEIPEEIFNEVIDETLSNNKEVTFHGMLQVAKKLEHEENIKEQREEIRRGIEIPDGLFDVIVIDPPWNYGRDYDPHGSRVANPYPEMTQDELKEIDIPFADDCVLFLWTTHQFIWSAKELVDYWGFTYHATIVWDKETIGMGFWLRMQCEFCLVATKGDPFWHNTEWRDIIREPRREHSRKPDKFYSLVEAVTEGKRLDYFSREKRLNWFTYGTEQF
jgi:N6-adenosine-specific RNA methylase IME4